MKVVLIVTAFASVLFGEEIRTLAPIKSTVPGTVSCGSYFFRGTLGLYYQYDLSQATGFGKSGSLTLATIDRKDKPQILVNPTLPPSVVVHQGITSIQVPAGEKQKIAACLKAIK